jgi:hypothetical protein
VTTVPYWNACEVRTRVIDVDAGAARLPSGVFERNSPPSHGCADCIQGKRKVGCAAC